MTKLTKEEMLNILDNNISRIENKEYTLYFYVIDTKGNPSYPLEYIYRTAYALHKRGHKVVMIHEENEFVGVENWLGEVYSSLPHMNVNKDQVEVSPSDFVFIPDVFANVMVQTKNLPCRRIVIVQNYTNLTEFMPISQTLDGLGIIDVIVTSKENEVGVKNYFPNVRTHIVPPSIMPMFRNNDEPRKLLINILAKDQSDVNKIVKPFFWRNPIYRWVSFRDLRGVSKEVHAEALREGAITVWIDDKTDFGVSLLEAIKCGGIVVAKIPEKIQEWMIEDNNLTNKILWFNSIDELHTLLPNIVRSWTTDSIPQEIYDRQSELQNLFTEDIQELEIIKVYENEIIGRCLNDFKEAKAEVKSNNLETKEE